jgi:primosomal protein N' (replication factor Y)
MARFVEVAVSGPIRTAFNYEWGEPLGEPPEPGARLAVPFGRSRKTAFLLREVDGEEAREAAGGRELREVAYVVDRESLVTPGVLELARWMSRRYLVGLGDVLSAALPGGVREDRRAPRMKIVRAAAGPEKLLEEACRIERRARKRAAALRLLAERGELPAPELAGGRSDAALVRWLVSEGLAEVREVLRRAAESPPPPRAPDFELTSAHVSALSKIAELRERRARLSADALAGGEGPALQHGTAGPVALLLQGVTGSGKTEVYLRAIAEEVARGRQAIVLVPEISLTPQTISRFGERFRRMSVLHSHMSDGERADSWRRARAGEVDVVIGARSAVFAPLPRLGLIVVDEEHETSYKQESSPRYRAPDAAVARAGIEGALAILGSATPSLESFLAARRGETARAALPERIGGRDLPPVEVVDMREERRRVKGYPVLSGRLEAALRDCVARGEQAILFLNRRGYSTFVHCPRCGEDVRCGDCDVPMTLHRERKRKARQEAPASREGGPCSTMLQGGRPSASGGLRCHYCGKTRPVPGMCPACGFGKLLPLGTGTERIVEAVRRTVPAACVGRMDTDAMTGRADYERVLGGFQRGTVDVLVGTQMIAKGHDLPRVTLVGVVNADVALHLPDFRASERAFQLIAQVAGRAGRSELGGRVVVQTSLPDSLPVRHGARHDFAGFADEELAHRREFAYPPFTRIARIVVEGPREEGVEKRMQAIVKALREARPGGTGEAGKTGGAGSEGREGAVERPRPRYSLLGPSEAPLGRLRGRRRQHLIVKAGDAETLERVLWSAEPALRSSGKTRVVVDVDPVSMR